MISHIYNASSNSYSEDKELKAPAEEGKEEEGDQKPHIQRQTPYTKFRIIQEQSGNTLRYEVLYKNLLRDCRKFFIEKLEEETSFKISPK
jgi:hypothetical protein